MRVQEKGQSGLVGIDECTATCQCISQCCGGCDMSALDRLWQEAPCPSQTSCQERGTQPFALWSQSFVVVWGSFRGLPRRCVMYVFWLSLVLAKLTGWPFVKSIGTFYHLTYMLQLQWLSFQDVCSAVRQVGRAQGFSATHPARCTLLTYF